MVASATQLKTVPLFTLLASALAMTSARAAVQPEAPLALLTVPGDRAGETVAELRLRARDVLPVGFGVVVAFDSGAIELVRCVDVLADGFLGDDRATEPDGADLDGDPATDRLVRLAWLSPLGEWAGNRDDALLARLVFRRTGAADAGELPHVTAVPLAGAALRPVRLSLRPPARRLSAAAARGGEAAGAEAETVERVEAVRELAARSWSLAARDAATCSLDADGNGALDALTDGILVMRHLFGFSGTSLVTGALGSGATRATGEAVAAFLGDAACTGMLDADGNGSRDALTDGILVARYLFGFTGSSLVTGALGSGATRGDGAAVAGHLDAFRSSEAVLVLRAPSLAAPLLSQVEASLLVGTTYTGSGTVAYALAQGPTGMAVDAAAGRLTWTPPAAMEGQSATVKVTASDGTLSGEVSFALQVAGATPLATNLAGDTVTVTQAGSLQGLAVTVPAGATLPASQVKVSTVPAGQAPPVPDTVTRISDFFRVTPVNGGTNLLTLVLPTAARPAGRAAEDLRLFVYTGGVHDFLDGSDPERVWIPTWYDLDVLPNGMVTIKLHGIGELCFLGVEEAPTTPATISGVTGTSTIRVGGRSVSIACVPRPLLNGLPSLSQEVCSLTGDVNLTVTLKQLANLHLTPAASRDELLGWLAEARKAFGDLGLSSDAAFEVVVEAMPPDIPNALGFVTTGNLEDRRVLHITMAAKPKSTVQGTVVHEYFHHAQGRTTSAGLNNVMALGRRGHWISEGTARWFEDELFDSLNTYRAKEGQPLARVLEWGVAETPKHEDNDDNKPIIAPTRAYARFAWWKMVRLSCSGFSLPELFNFDTATDPVGLRNLATRISSTKWQCDFGAGFGAENSATLGAALLYYTYATVKEDDISRLDSSEPYFPFEKSPWVLTPSPACVTSVNDCPATAKDIGTLLSAGSAVAHRLAAVDPLDPGMAAFVTVVNKRHDGTLWVWVGDNEKPGGLTDGEWFEVEPDDDAALVYALDTRAPETMVIVVNPNPDKEISYDIVTGLNSAWAIYPDMDSSIWAPVFSPGCPDVDFTLVLRGPAEPPSPYKVVWNFDDGTPEVTVTGDLTVVHRWQQVGDFNVTTKLYSLPTNTLIGQAQRLARIGYFYGQFQLSSFTGDTSGEFGAPETQHFLQLLAGVAADPTAAQVSVSRWSDGDLDAYLYDGTDEFWLAHYSTDHDNETSDCQQHFTIDGNHLSARWANPQYIFATGELAGQCMSLDMTQTGAQIDGTFSFWAKYYWSDINNNPDLRTEGQASYTFSGTYKK